MPTEQRIPIQQRLQQLRQQPSALPSSQITPLAPTLGRIPIQERLQQIRSQVPKQPTAPFQPVAPQRGPLETGLGVVGGFGEALGKTGSQFLAGVGKGAATTTSGFGGLMRKGLQVLLPKPLEKQFGVERGGLVERGIQQTEERLRPVGMAQQLGYGAEQLGELFIPGGAPLKIGKAVTGARALAELPGFVRTATGLLARAGTEAATAGGIVALQKQGKEAATTAAVISGAIPLVGRITRVVTGPLRSFLSERLAPRIVNSILKPLQKEFRFGKDPGLGVVEEGIVANTREGFLRQIADKKRQVGKEIGALLNPVKTQIDLRPIVNTLDDEIRAAVGKGEQQLVLRLQSIKQGLTKTFALPEDGQKIIVTKKGKEIVVTGDGQKIFVTGEKNLKLFPAEAAKFKGEIGDATKWTGQAFDNEVNQARVRLYRAINDAIEAIVPGSKKLNSRWANLLGAEKSLERTIDIIERQNILRLGEKTVGAAAAVASQAMAGDIRPETLIRSALFGFGGVAGTRLFSSPAFKTRLAQSLGKMNEKEKSTVAQFLRNLYLISLEK